MALHRSTRGLDLPLAGAPSSVLEPARPVTRVAVLGADAIGLKPGLRVAVGDTVRRGQPLFEDKARPGLVYTAPAAGTVEAIHRGERRAFVSLVIAADAREAAADKAADDGLQVDLAAYRGVPVERLDAAGVRALLLESGLWAALRVRPFGTVPAAEAAPAAVFVTATDTRPHAPPMEPLLAGREADLRAGLLGLLALGARPVYLCVGAGAAPTVPDGVQVEQFEGPHPAGNAGWHMHVLHPVGLARAAWHIGVQDLLAIGCLLRTGRIEVGRTISLGGPAVLRPRLLRTRLGACVDELVAGELDTARPVRVVSGSVLDGRLASGAADGYLGRFHQQIAALPEGGRRELFGWIAPGPAKHSVTGAVLGAFSRAPRTLDTDLNGAPRAMVPIGSYERVMPFDILPTFLLRALITRDDEHAVALGALELDEDDLAACTYVCPGKTDYGPLLRAALERIAREHA